jgi:hypothetical protein
MMSMSMGCGLTDAVDLDEAALDEDMAAAAADDASGTTDATAATATAATSQTPTAEQGTLHFDVTNLLGLDSHASARVQIANNGSLPPYNGSETAQAVLGGAAAATPALTADAVDAAQDAAEERGDTHSSIDQYIDLTSTNNILTALCTDDCTRYATTAYRVINTGNTEIHASVEEDVKALDDYYWNGKEWRDSFYSDIYDWSVAPGSYVEFTLPVNEHQGIFHNKVRGTYVKLYAIQAPQGPDHVKVTDGNIVTEFNVNIDALQLTYDEAGIRCVLLPLEYEPTLANIMDAMQANGYSPPLYMHESEEPEDLPILYIFEWYPQNGKFEVEVTKN